MNTILKFSSLMLVLALVFSCKPSGEKATTGEAAKVAEATGEKFTVSTDNSKVLWIGTKVTGQHNGDIKIKSGDISIENGLLTGGNFVIDMASINTLDLEGDSKNDLDGHLKNEDFFDVANHPEATFEVTKATKLMNDANANYIVSGNLTIKGITKEVTFKAKMMKENDMVSIKTPPFKIDRTEWGVKYGSASFFDGLKDKAISNDITMEVMLIAKK